MNRKVSINRYKPGLRRLLKVIAQECWASPMRHPALEKGIFFRVMRIENGALAVRDKFFKQARKEGWYLVACCFGQFDLCLLPAKDQFQVIKYFKIGDMFHMGAPPHLLVRKMRELAEDCEFDIYACSRNTLAARFVRNPGNWSRAVRILASCDDDIYLYAGHVSTGVRSLKECGGFLLEWND